MIAGGKLLARKNFARKTLTSQLRRWTPQPVSVVMGASTATIGAGLRPSASSAVWRSAPLQPPQRAEIRIIPTVTARIMIPMPARISVMAAAIIRRPATGKSSASQRSALCMTIGAGLSVSRSFASAIKTQPQKQDPPGANPEGFFVSASCAAVNARSVNRPSVR